MNVVPDVSADHQPDTSPADSADNAGAGALGAYTTLRLGGPAGTTTVVAESEELVTTVRNATSVGQPLFVLAGGSNVVIGDAGIPGTVVLVRTSGIRELPNGTDQVVLRVAAGEPWDDVVGYAVSRGYSGIECLSGIPGSTGATPIQNVGAYGQEVAQTIVAVHAYDRVRDRVVAMSPPECEFGYRSSIFKTSDRYVVVEVDFGLLRSEQSAPIRYAELARNLDAQVGDRVPVQRARDTVRRLRAGKGMVLDPTDHDTWSVGSFFTNPVVSTAFFTTLGEMPHWAGPNDTVKLAAAWLIEQAGFGKGFAGAGVSISTKHTLALTNRGTGTTAALLDLARTIRAGVHRRFGVELHPEPVLIGCTL